MGKTSPKDIECVSFFLKKIGVVLTPSKVFFIRNKLIQKKKDRKPKRLSHGFLNKKFETKFCFLFLHSKNLL